MQLKFYINKKRQSFVTKWGFTPKEKINFMKKSFKVVVVFVLMVCLLVSFTSCGANKKEIDPINREKELDLSLFHWSMTGFANSYKKSNVTKTLMDKLNISDFEVYTAPYSDWKSSFGLLASTGELPDFFKFDGPDALDQYTRWVKDEMLLPIDDWVTEDKYPNLYKHVQSYKHLNLGELSPDKKLYAIPVKGSQPNHVMVIRGDWVDNLNKKKDQIANIKYVPNSDYVLGNSEYKYPTTISDFYRMAVAMTYADPDNSGTNNTYGYTSSDTTMWYNHWIFNMFGSSYQDYMIDPQTGEYNSTWINDGSKNAIKFIKKMRDEGIIEPNFFANDPIGGMLQFFQGKIGMTLINGDWYNGEQAKMLDAFKEDIESGKVDPERLIDMVVPLPAGDGSFGSVEGARGYKGNYGYSWFCGINNDISDNKKDRILMLLDYMLSEEGTALTLYGVEGEHYKVEDGKIINLIENDEKGNPRTLKGFDYAWEIRQMIDLSTNYFMPWEKNYEKLQAMTEFNNGPDGGKSYAPTGIAGQTRITYEKALFDQSIEWYAKLIYGKTISGASSNNFDAAWDEFVNKYLDSKGREIILEINEIVNARG